MAARCPACATVFRVVQDQLRVSEGWVRCGRCAEVFNAIENLVDLDVDVATLTSTRSPGSERVMNDLAAVAAPPAAAGVDAGEPPDDITVNRSPSPPLAAAAAASAVPVAAAVATGLPQADPVDDAAKGGTSKTDAEPRPEPVGPRGIETSDSSALASTTPGLDPAAALDLRAEPHMQPRFVRVAERAAWWRRPVVRGALAGVGAVFAVALALQVAFEYRDLLAARWPSAKPWFQQACAAVGCAIAPPRAIDGLAVESSGLVRIEGTPLYRLSVVLRNRTAIALAVPSIDLTLTDSQGGVVARRVVEVAQLGGSHVADVAALAEIAMQTTLGVGDRVVSGYTIEIFYP